MSRVWLPIEYRDVRIKMQQKKKKQKQKGVHVRMYSSPYILFCSTGISLCMQVYVSGEEKYFRLVGGWRVSPLLFRYILNDHLYLFTFFVQLLRSVMKNTFLKNGWIWKKNTNLEFFQVQVSQYFFFGNALQSLLGHWKKQNNKNMTREQLVYVP